MSLGERLKTIRNELGLEAQFVAEKLNIAKSTYSGYENDKTKPSIEMLESLSNFYNVSVDYLLGRTMIKKSDDPGFISIAAHALDNLSEDDQKELLEYAKILKKKRDSLNGK